MNELIPALLATAYLVLKFFLSYQVGKYIAYRFKTLGIASFLAGWSFVFAFQICVILLLSSVGWLRQPYFISCLMLSLALASQLPTTAEKTPFFARFKPVHVIALAPIAVAVVLMWLRAIYLSDFTWDAQAYELPRIVIWLNRASVFIHMPTAQLNLFVNEWNGELNALAYCLVSGSYVGFMFGNLEIFITLFAAITWVLTLLKVRVFPAIVISAIVGITPTLIGLASTVKGDLLAVVAFIICVGWLIELRRTKMPCDFGMVLVAASLAVGAKISVTLPVIAIVGLGFMNIDFNKCRGSIHGAKLFVGLTTTAVLIFSARFIANLIVYGNPLRRVDVEKSSVSVAHLLGNIQIAGQRMFDFSEDMNGRNAVWALATNMGGSIWCLLLLCCIGGAYLVRRSRQRAIKGDLVSLSDDNTSETRWLCTLGLVLAVATLASMTLAEAYQWTFRYFAPEIIVLCIGITAFFYREIEGRWLKPLFALAAIAVLLLNGFIGSRQGEIVPTATLEALPEEISRAGTALQRASLFIKGPYQAAAVDTLRLDTSSAQRLLLFKDLDAAMMPFLGSHAQNRIELVDSLPKFLAAASRQDFHAIAVVQGASVRDPQLPRLLDDLNYLVLVNNIHYLIAMPKGRITLDPYFTLMDFKWVQWNSAVGATISSEKQFPSISSSIPVDTGLVSQELTSDSPVLVRASFEGNIKGVGSHAAHISLHGEKLAIELPPGTYTDSQTWETILPAPAAGKPFRLSFGLGGWAEGQGTLRLKRLDLYRLKFNNSWRLKHVEVVESSLPIGWIKSK